MSNVKKIIDEQEFKITGKNSLSESEKKEISDNVKERINQELLQSGGILRDYDNNQILYPIALDIIAIVSRIVDYRRKNL